MGKKKNNVQEFKMLNNRFKILIGIIIYILIMSGVNIDEITKTLDIELPSFGKEEVVVIPEGTAKMTFIDVGQGDSSLIQFGDYDILIDAGERDYGDDIVRKLQDLGVDDIEYLVATHPHSDHIGGIPEVIENFVVENVVMPDVAHTTKTFERMIDSIDEKNINVIIPYEGEVLIDSEGAVLRVISPVIEGDSNLNNYSICLKFDFGNTRAIYTGDAEVKIEKMILEGGTSLDADIYKVGHHGSVTSNTERFLEAMSPQIGIISAGKGNDYGHPHKEIVERFEEIGTNMYTTFELGDITITTDGVDIEVVN